MEKVLISFSVLLLSALALGACGSPVASSKTSTSSVPSASLSSSPASASSSSAGARLKAKTVELYQTETAHSPFQLFFDQTIPDIPFIALPDAKDFLVEVIAAELKDSSYALALNDEAGVITLTRENGSKAVFDFNHQTLTFNSFEAFSTLYFAATPLDPVSLHSKDSAGNPLYLIHDQTNSSSKAKGVSLNLNLAAYQIPLVYEGGVGYIPVQTYSDLFLSQTLGTLAYNGTALFLANGSFAPVQALYYSAAPRKRSVALSEFTYHELCLALDVYYGLKNEHGIVDFDSYFTNNGVKADLLSTDAAVADKALARFINYHFEDFHSAFLADSSFAGSGASGKVGASPDMINQYQTMNAFSTVRTSKMGKNPLAYQAFGDTAFVTFDKFTSLSGDYYTNKLTDPLYVYNSNGEAEDTFAIVAYAHSQITSNSAIKNVVIDLSCNGGGALDALAYIGGWLQSNDILDVRSSIDGMRCETSYKVDVNLDKVFDAKDTISDKKIYCLISPASFSCGNYLPSMLKIRQKATMIGQTSGGGGCMVKPLSTADGALLQVSGPMIMSVAKNGTFNDIDQGVAADYRLNDPNAFYDRQAIATAIDAGVYGAQAL